MPIISNITSQNTSLNSTMDLVVNQGSTTVRLTAAQVISAIFSTAGDLLYAASSIDISRLAPPTTANPNNVNVLHYSSGSDAPIWSTMSSGELITVTSAGNLTHLTPPTSDSILQYSTINGAVGPAWFTPGDGELLMSDADGDLEFLTIGTAGRLLQSTGGIPAWVGMSSHSIFVGSVDQVPTELAGPGTSGSILITDGSSAPSWLARGTSEQILSIVSGLPVWRASTAILSTILTAAGDILRRSSAGIERLAGGSSAAILEYSTADGTVGPQWQLLNQGEIIVGTTGSAGAAGPVGVLAQPSAGAIMRYSTVDGSSGPEWFDLTSGQFIKGSSVEGNPIAFAVPSSGAVLTHSTVNGAFGPAWLDVSTGELVTRSSDGTMKSLAIPSSDSILQFSTVDGSIGPIWLTPGDGEILISDADGDLDFLTAGSSEQVLTITDAVPAWQTGGAGGGGTTEACILSINSNQAFTSGSYQAINWTSELLDTDDFHSTVSNTSRLVIPTSGVYMFSVNGLFNGASSRMILLLGDATGSSFWAQSQSSFDSDHNDARLSLTALRHFASSGSTVIAFIFSDDASTLGIEDLTPQFSAHRLS